MTATSPLHRRDDPPTSREAATQLTPHLSALQFRVLWALCKLHQRTKQGATDGELERLPDFTDCKFSTVRKRRAELRDKGHVAESGCTREGMTAWIPSQHSELAARLLRKASGELF